MMVKMKGFMNGEPILVNTSQLVRAVGMKDHTGCVLSMADCSKIMVGHDMNELCEALGAFLDLTAEEAEG